MADTHPRGTAAVQAVCVLAGTLMLYGVSAAPGLLWGDSARLQAGAATLEFDFGNRGYPLYGLLTWLAGRGLPFGTLAFRVTLVSVLFGAAAVALTFLALVRMRFSLLAALATSAALAVSHGLWSQSVVAEVYSLHAFLVAALLALTAGPDRLTRRRVLLLGLVLGLGCLHHRTTLFLYPACLAFLVLRRRELLSGASMTIATVSGAALALAPCVPILLAGGPGSLPSSALDPSVGRRLLYFGGFFVLSFPSPALLLIPAGLAARAKRLAPFVFPLAAVGVHLVFMLFVPWFGDQHVFLLPVLVLATPFAAAGLDALRARRPRIARLTAASLLLLPVLVYAGLAAYFSRPNAPRVYRADRAYARAILFPPKSDYRLPREFCEGVLDRLPEHSRVLAGWAEGNALLYLQQIEGRRPDVEVMLCDTAASRRKALEDAPAETFLTRFPHFAASHPPPGLPEGYRLTGEGFLLRIVRD